MKESFSAEEWRERMSRARAIPAAEIDVPQGWSRSHVDPAAIVRCFFPLRLKPGFILRAYLFREGLNGNGFVYAVPQGAALPDPAECKETSQGHFLSPPVPPGSLGNAMDAIDGDGSAESFFAASLLSRELKEFGALWHGIDWGTHSLLDFNPMDEEAARAHFGMSKIPAASKWKWDRRKPRAWKPSVDVTSDKAVVKFYTYSGLHTDAIYSHEDTFSGSYVPKTVCIRIAEGPGGYVF